MRVPAFLLALLLSNSAQVVQFGPTDPDYCYKVENIEPNLTLFRQVHILGRVRDQTTAPFKNSQLQLRRYLSQRRQTVIQIVSTDDDGRFDLGIVKPGKYRLLASPSRAFKQPSALECHNGKDCELEITLVVSPTDQLTSNCPIR